MSVHKKKKQKDGKKSIKIVKSKNVRGTMPEEPTNPLWMGWFLFLCIWQSCQCSLPSLLCNLSRILLHATIPSATSTGRFFYKRLLQAARLRFLIKALMKRYLLCDIIRNRGEVFLLLLTSHPGGQDKRFFKILFVSNVWLDLKTRQKLRAFRKRQRRLLHIRQIPVTPTTPNHGMSASENETVDQTYRLNFQTWLKKK